MSAMTPRARAVVVYESMFGNTEKVAEAIARGLRSGGLDTAEYNVGRADLGNPVRADLLVVGAPTHGFSLSRPSTREDAIRRGAASSTEIGVREWLTSGSSSPEDVSAIAIFDTRVEKVRRLPMTAARSAAKIARRRGFRIVGRSQGFTVDDVEGPLCDGELERAEEWGRSLAGVVAQRGAGASD